MNQITAKDSINIDQKIREAQIQLLYRQTWTGLSGSIIVCLTACLIFWHVVPQWKLSLWAAISVLLTFVRGATMVAFQKRNPAISEFKKWANFHVVGTVFSAVLWSLPFIFFWPENNPLYQLVWPILVLPLSAAAVATYYTWNWSYASFVLLSVVPISLRFFYEGGFLFNILGVLSLFYIGVLLRAGKIMNAASARTFEFGIRNEALNIDLQEGIDIRENLNAQLQQQVSEITIAEREKAKLIHELQGALEEIKTLKGVIPICMHCKGIRDGKGYWNELEQYISEHSDAQFSHGVCNDCLKKHYSDEDDE